MPTLSHPPRSASPQEQHLKQDGDEWRALINLAGDCAEGLNRVQDACHAHAIARRNDRADQRRQEMETQVKEMVKFRQRPLLERVEQARSQLRLVEQEEADCREALAWSGWSEEERLKYERKERELGKSKTAMRKRLDRAYHLLAVDCQEGIEKEVLKKEKERAEERGKERKELDELFELSREQAGQVEKLLSEVLRLKDASKLRALEQKLERKECVIEQKKWVAERKKRVLERKKWVAERKKWVAERKKWVAERNILLEENEKLKRLSQRLKHLALGRKPEDLAAVEGPEASTSAIRGAEGDSGPS